MRPRAMIRDGVSMPTSDLTNSKDCMTSSTTKYPLFDGILSMKNVPLQPTYTVRNVAEIFAVTPRAIQNRIASGQLVPRDLPERAKFLSQDLEDFLIPAVKRLPDMSDVSLVRVIASTAFPPEDSTTTATRRHEIGFFNSVQHAIV